jgi:hypothetical protein
MRQIAALYVDAENGPYAHMPGVDCVDCWDVERNAKVYPGPGPVVAHPPCGPWGALAWRCSKQDPECGPIAVTQLRAFGGVLEHPANSALWDFCRLPKPGEFPRDGLWTLEVDQCRWGHRARKRTWLLFSRIEPCAVGELPPWQEPTHVVDSSSLQKRTGADVKHLPKGERHLTPPAFAEWLVALALQAR